MKRQPGIEEVKKISTLQQQLIQRTRQMKALVAELNMYQAQVNEYKYDIEKLGKDHTRDKELLLRAAQQRIAAEGTIADDEIITMNLFVRGVCIAVQKKKKYLGLKGSKKSIATNFIHFFFLFFYTSRSVKLLPFLKYCFIFCFFGIQFCSLMIQSCNQFSIRLLPLLRIWWRLPILTLKAT